MVVSTSRNRRSAFVDIEARRSPGSKGLDIRSPSTRRRPKTRPHLVRRNLQQKRAAPSKPAEPIPTRAFLLTRLAPIRVPGRGTAARPRGLLQQELAGAGVGAGWQAFPLHGELKSYRAPPLDGVWATAPYFHNSSAPTVYHVLNSKARPKVYTRTYGTSRADYDEVKLGHKISVLTAPPSSQLSGFELRKIYDTSRPGLANTGHTYGDDLTDAERFEVIEYLKTL